MSLFEGISPYIVKEIFQFRDIALDRQIFKSYLYIVFSVT